MTLSIFVGFTVSRSKNFATKNFSFDGLIAMVIFSAIGLFVQNLFRITATVQLIMCHFWNANNSCILPDYQNKIPPKLPVEPALYLTVDLVNVLQVIFQISFVCYCQKVLKPTGEKDKGSRRAFNASLAHLAVCNLSCWLVDSVLVVTDFSPTDIFFGEALWKLLYNIVAPFTLFFRFNCMLFFARAFLWNKDAEIMKRASWNILNRRYRIARGGIFEIPWGFSLNNASSIMLYNPLTAIWPYATHENSDSLVYARVESGRDRAREEIRGPTDRFQQFWNGSRREKGKQWLKTNLINRF